MRSSSFASVNLQFCRELVDQADRKATVTPITTQHSITTVVSSKASQNKQLVEPWGVWTTRAEHHIRFQSCQPKPEAEAMLGTASTGLDRKKTCSDESWTWQWVQCLEFNITEAAWLCGWQICSNYVMQSCKHGLESQRNLSNTLWDLCYGELRRM